jgi:hypothetical protein
MAPACTAISNRNKIPKLLEVKTNSWKKKGFIQCGGPET